MTRFRHRGRRVGTLPALGLLVAFVAVGACGADGSRAAAGVEQWEEDIRAFEEADRVSPPPKGAIVFVGSSSIRRWDTLEEDFPGVEVIKRGFGGSQMSDAAHYAERIVLPYEPRQVVVYAGDNDLWADRTPERVLEDFQTLVSRIHERLPEARVSFIAIKPSLARWSIIDRVREANRLVMEYAATDPRIDYIDVYTPMLASDGTPRAELLVDDELHLSAEGYEVWREAVAPFILR